MYDYNSFGSLSSITSNGNTISYFYDQYGFQDSVYNAYSGGVRFSYNAFGELVSQRDAKGQEVQIQYDILGRVTSKTTPLGTTSYSYYTDGGGIRQVSGISAPGNTNETFTYDTYGRVSQYSKSIQNEIKMNYSFGYDSYGNNTSMTYPSGLGIVNIYNSNGDLTEIQRTNGQSIWKLNDINASGKPEVVTLGYNTINLFKHYLYNSFDNLVYIKTGNWQQIYDFNDTTGNLMSRSYRDFTNPSNLMAETFQYDEFDRLTTAQISGLQAQVITFSAAGNILNKSGIGEYTYDLINKNSLQSVENISQIISSSPQHIYYNYLNKPDSITEGNFRYNLIYGADNQRIKSMLMDSTVLSKAVYYGPGYEKIITPDSTYENHYIASPYGLEAIIVKKNNTERLYYTETDHLGSLIGLINSTGGYAERHSYDPWGRRRNPTDWSYSNVPEPVITDRGYTGHEHLDIFGLINMNGRIYDPVTARFLNVDPVLQDPSNSQNFNSYSYCLNNPLKYIDPSGYSESDLYERPNVWQAYLTACNEGYGGDYGEYFFQFWVQSQEYLLDGGSGGFGGSGGESITMTFTWNTFSSSYFAYIVYDPLVGPEPSTCVKVTEHRMTMPISYGTDGIWPSGDGGDYSINNALNWLNGNSHPTFSAAKAAGDGARCGYFVRMALEAGGINTTVHPVPARLYGSYLKNWGFTQVYTTNYLKGDIAVIQGYRGGTADINGVPYGHIQMYNGTQWLSNFYQNNFWPGPDYQKYQPAIQIYRMNP